MVLTIDLNINEFGLKWTPRLYTALTGNHGNSESRTYNPTCLFRVIGDFIVYTLTIPPQLISPTRCQLCLPNIIDNVSKCYTKYIMK